MHRRRLSLRYLNWDRFRRTEIEAIRRNAPIPINTRPRRQRRGYSYLFVYIYFQCFYYGFDCFKMEKKKKNDHIRKNRIERNRETFFFLTDELCRTGRFTGFIIIRFRERRCRQNELECERAF